MSDHGKAEEGPADALWEALRDSPSDARAFLKLRDRLVSDGDLKGVVALYRARAEAVGDREAAHLELAIAEKWGRALADKGLIQRAYECSLQKAARVPDLLEGLRELFWKKGQWELLETVLRWDAERATSAENRAAAFLELARFRAAKLEQPDAAAEAYLDAFRASPEAAGTSRKELEELYTGNPASEPLFEALGQIMLSTGRHGDRLQLLRHHLGALPEGDGATRRPLLLECARLSGLELGMWGQSLGFLQEALEGADASEKSSCLALARKLVEQGPDEPRLFALVEDLAVELERWDELVLTCRVRAERSASHPTRAQMRFLAGEILWAQLGDREGALDEFEEAARHDRAVARQVAERFRRLIESGDADVTGSLQTRIEAVLKAAGDSAAVLALWKERLAHAQDPGERVTLLRAIGDLHRTDMRRPEGAFDYYAQAADDARQSGRVETILEALFALQEAGVRRTEVEALIERLATEGERWVDVLRLLNGRLERAESATEAAALNERLGELLQTKLGEPQGAADHFAAAAEAAPDNMTYLAHARQALSVVGRWPEALAYLDRELSLTATPEERKQLILRRAELTWSELRNPVQSLRFFLSSVHGGMEAEEDLGTYIRGKLTSDVGLKAFQELLEATAAHNPGDAASLAGLAARLLGAVSGEAADNASNGVIDALLIVDRFAALEAEQREHLQRRLRELRRFEDLAEALERQADWSPEVETRRAALEQLIAVCRDQLGDEERMIRAYWGLVDVAVDPLETLRGLIDTLSGTERSAELARAYDTALSHLDLESPPTDYPRMLEGYAGLLHQTLGRADLASEAYFGLLGVEPFNPHALAFFESYYSLEQDAPSLYQVLRATVDHIQAPSDRSRRLAELARLAAERLGDQAAAASHWEAILQLPEADPQARNEAIEALEAKYRAGEQREDLVRVLRAELHAITDDQARAATLHKLADLLVQMDRHEEVLPLLEDLLQLEPSDAELLERAADTAWQLGDPAVEASYVRRLTEVAEDPRTTRLRLARILGDELALPGEAMAEVRQVLRRDPGDAAALELAEELMQRLQRPDEWLQLLREQAEASPTPEQRIQVLLRVADADLMLQGEKDWAAWALSEIVALRPDRRDVALRLIRHLEDRGDWNQAVDAIRGLLARTLVKDDQVELLRRMGSITEHQLQDVESARRAYESVAELVPDEVGAYRALLRLAEKSGDLDALPRLTDKILALDPTAQDADELAQRAANVALEELANPRAAIGVLESLVKADPLKQEALERLSNLYADAERWRDLEGCLDRLAGLAQQDTSRIDLWSRRGTVLEERLGDQEAAAQCYRDILQLQPGNRLALHALKRVYTGLEQWEEVLSVLSRLAQIDTDPVIRAATYREAADVHERHLGESVKAMELHRTAHDLLVDETVSMQALERLAETHGLWKLYADVLMQDIERAHTPEQQDERLLKCASIIEAKLEDPVTAFDLLNIRFYPTPRDDELFQSLVDVGVRNGLWDQLEQCHQRLVQVTLEPREQVRIYHRLARLLLEQAGLPARALRVLGEAHVTQPQDPETIELMESVAGQHGLWEELDSFFEERWTEAQELREKIDILLKRAALLDGKMGRWEDGLDQIVIAIQLDPENPEVQGELYRYAAEHDLWETVLKLFDLLVKDREERAFRRRLLEEMARISAEELDSPDRAFEYAARAWRVDPGNEALRTRLVERAEAAGRLDALADAFEWEASTRPALEDRASASYRLAQLCLVGLDDLDRAVWALTNAYKMAPSRGDAIAMLRSAMESRGLLSQCLAILTEWIEHAPQANQRAALFRAIGEIATQLELVDEAKEAYRGVLTNDPTDLVAIEQLAAIHRQAGDWSRVIRCLQQELDVVEDPKSRAAIVDEIAALYARLERYDEAISTLERSIVQFPERNPPVDALVDLYRTIGRPQAAVRLLERMAERPDSAIAASALLSAAEIALDELDDAKRAGRLATRLVRKDRNHRGAWRLLARLAEINERWQDQVEALLELAERTRMADLLEGEQAEQYAKLLQAGRGEHFAACESLPPPNASAIYFGLAALSLERRLYYTDRARTMWRRAGETDPLWALAPLEVARISRELGEWERAAAAARQAVERLKLQGSKSALSHAWIALALALEQQPKRDDEVLDAYEAAVVADPANHAARSQYHALIESSGNGERAAELYRRLLDREADSGERRAALIGYAWAQELVGRDDVADRARTEAFELADSNDPEVNRVIARMALERGEYGRAAELFLGVLAALEGGQPGGPGGAAERLELHKDLARAAELDGQHALAQEHYSRAYAADPTDLGALLGLGRIAVERGALALADQCIEDVLAAARSDHQARSGAYLLRADVLAAQDDESGALEVLEPLSQRKGEAGRAALERLLQIHGHHERWPDVERCLLALKRRARSGPEIAAALLQLAHHYLEQQGDPDKAWHALSEAIAEDGGHVEALKWGLSLAVRTERYEPGLKIADGLLEMLTETGDRVRYLLLAAHAAQGAEIPERALAHFSAALELDPHNAEAIDGVIAAHKRGEDWEGLRGFLERHLERIGAGHPLLQGRLLRTLAGVLTGPLEDYEAAVPVYRALVVEDPTDADVLHGQLALAQVLEQPDVECAIEALRGLAVLGRMELAGLRWAQRALGELGQNDRAYLVTALLDVTQEATAGERRHLHAWVIGAGVLEALPPLKATLLDSAIRSPAVPAPVLDRLRWCAAAASAGANPVAGAPHPLATRFESVCRWIGLTDVELLTSASAGAPTLRYGDPWAVVAGPNCFESLPEAGRRFELARLVAQALPEYRMCAALDDLDFAAYHMAALEPLGGFDDAGFGRDEALESMVDRWRQLFTNVSDAESTASQDDADGPATTVSALPGPAAWRRNAATAGLRLGLLWSDDLGAALRRVLAAESGDVEGPVEGPRDGISSWSDLNEAMRRSGAVSGLVSYTLSPEYAQARKQLGLAREQFNLSADLSTDGNPLRDKSVAEFEMEITSEAVPLAAPDHLTEEE